MAASAPAAPIVVAVIPPVSPTVALVPPSLLPAIDVEKIPLGAKGFATDMLAATTEQPGAADGTGAFRTVCDFSHMSFDDPIVYPGQSGKSHLHAFFGNTATSAASTAASIATSGNSTCRGGTVNRSAYWFPAVIDSKDNSPVKPDVLIVYYKSGYQLRASTIQAFPVGLRMIAGSAAANPQVENGPTRISCIDPKTGQGPFAGHMPAVCPAGHSVWASVTYPQCWDGINLDSPDHISHMAYPREGTCPVTHPIPVPEITTNIVYTVREADAPARWRLSSDAYDRRALGGYSLHGDWMNGWRPDAMEAFVAGCDRAAKDCRAHLLGNGQRMLGVGS